MGQMLWAYVEYEWTEWTGLRGVLWLICENECYREIGGLDGIVLMLQSYGVWLLWVGESQLGMGIIIVGL